MITKVFKQWFNWKWVFKHDPNLIESYKITFSTQHGQRVLFHLLDTVYCTVYKGTDPSEALAHNYRRSVIHEILENLDMVEHPGKYQTFVEGQGVENGVGG